METFLDNHPGYIIQINIIMYLMYLIGDKNLKTGKKIWKYQK